MKTLEDLVILLALRNYIEDLEGYILESSKCDDSSINESIDIAKDLLDISKETYNKIAKNIPDYERKINEYIHTDKSRPCET